MNYSESNYAAMNYFSRTCFTYTTRKLKHKDTFKNVWTLSKLYLNSALTVFNGCRWHNSLKWSFMQKSQSIRHISLYNVIIPPGNHKGIFKQMQWVLWVPYHPLLWIFMNSKIRAITLPFFFLLLFNVESKGILFEININTMSWLNI